MGVRENYLSYKINIKRVNSTLSIDLRSSDFVLFRLFLKAYILTAVVCCSGTNTGGKVEAVIGTDFSIYFFNQMLEDIYPICADRTRYRLVMYSFHYQKKYSF